MKPIDITAQRFGNLVAVARAPNNAAGRAMWHCLCDCGKRIVVIGKDLRRGHSSSCGCVNVLDRAQPVPPAPLGATWVPLGHGRFALVDVDAPKEVFERRWKFQPNGYAVRSGRTGERYLHKLVAPTAGQLDHINGNRLDDRRENLRPATSQQNNRNRQKLRPRTSVYKGVYYFKRTGRWRAGIKVDRRNIHLGYFDTQREAAEAYDAAALRTFAEFAKPNGVLNG